MKVTVLTHTPDPERVVAAAARLCYSNTSASGLMENFSDEKASAFIKKLMDMGHMSPTEHVSFTFAIDGVSRTLLAQITRHRIASFSVQSLRYNNPFKGQKSTDIKELSTESLYYLEGLVFASDKQSDIPLTLKAQIEQYDIKGKSPEEVPDEAMAAYLRGIYEAAGTLLNKDSASELDRLEISFPKKFEGVFDKSHINFTQLADKILIENEDALEFIKYIYLPLDLSVKCYEKDKLLELCQISPEFFHEFVQSAIKYADEKYYSFIPQEVLKTPEAILEYINGLDSCKQSYLKLVEMGVDQEDARYILPMGTQTRIVMTMNVRSLYNFFNLRCCRRAQSEIRQLAYLMLKEVKKIAPGLFEKAGAPCEATGYCPEGEFSCGRYPTTPKENTGKK